VKLIVALLTLLVVTASPARERASPYPQPSAASTGDDAGDAAAVPLAPPWRATQVNRCSDVNGRVKLQDVPCTPLAPTSPEPAVAAAAVVELSSLAPRPQVESSRGSVRAPEASSLASVMLSLAWKLGLFVAVGYAIFRLLRAWRDAYRFAPPPADSRASSFKRSR